MNWRRGGFISERLTEVLIPICVFGMLASLILHLIDLRTVFLVGGEGNLRQATLAFAAAVVLLERLSYLKGPTIARAYNWAVGIAITLFALYYTDAFRLPASFFVVFLITEALFGVLWWAGHQLSKACSIADDKALAEVAEGGIMRKFRFPFRKKAGGSASSAGTGKDTHTIPTVSKSTDRSKNRSKSAGTKKGKPDHDQAAKPGDEHWTEKLSTRHPGRVLLYFSLFAIPVFGLGLVLFDPKETPLWRLGLMFFLYLWCALSLLFLSSLRQLAVYFRQRDVSLPDLIGLPWLALGFLGVTVALALAFLLPQPPSPLNVLVRHQLVASYKGWESKYGLKSNARSDKAGEGKAGKEGKPGEPEPWSGDNIHKINERYENIDKMKDPGLSEVARNSGFETDVRGIAALSAAFNDSMTQIFRGVMRVILGLAGVSAVVVALITIVVFIKRLRDGAGESLDKARKWFLGDGKKKPLTRPATRRFPSFADPFGDPERMADRNKLIRYLWEAMLAYCADAGAPCSPDLTPLEFVDTAPEPLLGFEERARFIARLFTFSQFSSQPLAETSLTDLQRFWHDLQRHAAGV